MSRNQSEGPGWGCVGVVLMLALLLFSHLMSDPGTPSTGGRANEVLSEESEAANYTIGVVEAATDSGDLDRAEAAIRARDAHLRERIQDLESSSEFSAEDKERILRPMRMEAETMSTAVEAYDGLSR